MAARYALSSGFEDSEAKHDVGSDEDMHPAEATAQLRSRAAAAPPAAAAEELAATNVQRTSEGAGKMSGQLLQQEVTRPLPQLQQEAARWAGKFGLWERVSSHFIYSQQCLRSRHT